METFILVLEKYISFLETQGERMTAGTERERITYMSLKLLAFEDQGTKKQSHSPSKIIHTFSSLVWPDHPHFIRGILKSNSSHYLLGKEVEGKLI